MTHWFSVFSKTTHLSIRFVFSQRTAAAADALMMKPDHPCIISHMERSALSLRPSLNHQQYPENLFMHLKLP